MARLRRSAIAARFDKAAGAYEDYAVAQMEILERVAALMRGEMGAGELWCDAGSGGGALIKYLGVLPEGTRFVCLDIAREPLIRAMETGRTGMAVCGDIDIPPFKYGIYDGAAAVSALQWSSSPKDALRNIAMMIKPGGRLYFSVFVDGSFCEINKLREQMDLPPAVWLPDVDTLINMLDAAGFDISKNDVERFEKIQRFPNAISALKNLSAIGATASSGRLLNKGEIAELVRCYDNLFSDDSGVRLTYRAVIGAARRGDVR